MLKPLYGLSSVKTKPDKPRMFGGYMHGPHPMKDTAHASVAWHSPGGMGPQLRAGDRTAVSQGAAHP